MGWTRKGGQYQQGLLYVCALSTVAKTDERFRPQVSVSLRGMDENQLITAIAITHVELILFHTFREGNGGLSRLLADVMAVKEGCKSLVYHSGEQNEACVYRQSMQAYQ